MSQHSEEFPETSKSATEFHQPRLNEVAQKFMADLEEERQRLGEEFPLVHLLIDDAVDRICSTGRIPGREFYADVYKQKPIKITQKVFVPIKQYPKFNFTGKILGPKGNSLRRLQEETQCKIVIKGRSSIRDRNKEEELRNSRDPRYAHLQKDLFLEISTVATPAESYARVAYALAEIRKYLIPDKNDEVSHEQLRELMNSDPESAKTLHGPNAEFYRSVFDKKIAPPSPTTPKYVSLIKRTSYNPHEVEEPEEEIYEYEHRIPKRPIPAGYEYVKARPVPSTSAYKRPPPPEYATDLKRLREAPVKTHKPTTYAILKKYK